MTWWQLAYLAGVLVTWPLNASAIYAAARRSEKPPETSLRQDAGMSIAGGLVVSALWPVFTFVLFCVTGFYEHGLAFPGRRP